MFFYRQLHRWKKQKILCNVSDIWIFEGMFWNSNLYVDDTRKNIDEPKLNKFENRKQSRNILGVDWIFFIFEGNRNIFQGENWKQYDNIQNYIIIVGRRIFEWLVRIIVWNFFCINFDDCVELLMDSMLLSLIKNPAHSNFPQNVF